MRDPRCSICQRSQPELKAINNAIRAGDSLREIARRHNTTPDTIKRHKRHVFFDIAHEEPNVPMPTELQKAHQFNFVQDILNLKNRALVLLTQAERAKDLSAAVALMREIRSQIETIIKVALAQKELEQKDVKPDEGVKDLSPDILEIIRRGIDFSEDLNGAEDAEYEVMEDPGGNGK